MKIKNFGVIAISFFFLPTVLFAQTIPAQDIIKPMPFGSKGDEVKRIQKILASDPDNIFPKNMITGYYGPITDKAMKIYQSRNNTNSLAVSTSSNQIQSSQKPVEIIQPDVPFISPKDNQNTSSQSEHYIVRYKVSPSVSDENTLKYTHGASVRHKSKNFPIISADMNRSEFYKLTNNPNVLSVEIDKKVQIHDIEYGNTWGVNRLGASSTFSNGITGQGIKVAVLDTGVDYNNSELIASYAGGYNFVSGNTNPMDDNGHGTHIAGTIAAAHNGGGVVGVAPNVQLYALKVLDSTGTGYTSSIIAALDWAIANGVKVTNNSYGSATDLGQAAADAFAKAEQVGILSVAAAGNSGTCSGGSDTVVYPARYSSVLAVSATDASDSRPCFSSTGSKVELAAPGVNINSTKLGGGTTLYSGTSMATPHVAGVAALVAEAGIKANQPQTGSSIRKILDSTAYDLGTVGIDTFYGYGLVNAYKAVNSILSNVSTTTPSTSTTTSPTSSTTPVLSPKPINKNPNSSRSPRLKGGAIEEDDSEKSESKTNESWHRTIPTIPPQAQTSQARGRR